MKHLSPQTPAGQDRVASAIFAVVARLVALLFAAVGRTPRRRGVSLAAECGLVDAAEEERLRDLWGNTRIWAMVLPAVFPADAAKPVRAGVAPDPSRERRDAESLCSCRVLLPAAATVRLARLVVRPASCADPPGRSRSKGRMAVRSSHAYFATLS